MVQATTVRRGSKERVRVYRFDIRLIEQGSLWNAEAVQTFKRSKVEGWVRRTPSGFRRYRQEMDTNGFELLNVREMDSQAGAA